MPDTDPNKTVFISYRRAASWAYAKLIFDHLHKQKYDVFMDIESLGAGNFGEIIFNQIAARAHFLIILAPSTIERFNEPDDWLRREIEEAFRLQRNIVPILVSEFSFSQASQYLTGQLSKLKDLNSLKVPYEHFDDAMKRLRKQFLNQRILGSVQLSSPAEQAEVERRIEAVAVQPAPTEKELNAEEYYNRAYSAYENGDYDLAIEASSAAIKLKPDFAAAYNWRGSSHDKKGDYEAASIDYTSAISHHPNDFQYRFERANIFFAAGNLKSAYSTYSITLGLVTILAATYLHRAMVFKALNEFDKMRFDIKHAGEMVHLANGLLICVSVTNKQLGSTNPFKEMLKELIGADAQYSNPEWLEAEFKLPKSLVEEARKLIANIQADG